MTSTRGSVPVRERILMATLEVIAEQGLDAVRHRQVADLAGVSPGSTTYHFASRDELIDEAFAYYLDRAATLLAELAPPPSAVDRPADALLAYLDALLDREFRSPRLVQAEYELVLRATRSAMLAQKLADWEDVQAAQFESFLRATGAIHPEQSAQVLVALIRGLELERLIHPDRRADLSERVGPLLRACWSADG